MRFSYYHALKAQLFVAEVELKFYQQWPESEWMNIRLKNRLVDA